MLKSSYILFLSLVFFLSNCATSKVSIKKDLLQKIKKIGITRFELDKGLAPNIGTEAENYFATVLIENGFSVVERSRLDAIIKEQALANTGLTDGDLTKLGQLAQADTLLVGKILECNEGQRMVEERLKDGGTTNVNRIYYNYKLSLRLVSVETGETSLSQQTIGEEYIVRPDWPHPNDFSGYRSMTLEGMAADFKNALKKKN